MSGWLNDEAVHLVVDPGDVESLMALKATSAWAEDKGFLLKVWPLLKDLGNPAADVPAGDSEMERLKARRAAARAQYRALEQQRASDYAGLPSPFELDRERVMALALWLRDASLDRLSMAGVWVEFKQAIDAALAKTQIIQANAKSLSDSPSLTDIGDGLIERGLYTAPAFLARGQVLIGMGHLPLIEAIWRAKR